ncbi:DUF4314 domain-containing protein [Spirillospora sp. CA-128828]|uniref:DUF4314 domain-containing protein n=1 Tax=Spirillospora sp. CA-128828 TaxID=3240033 RepID=UPI003D8C7697
MTQYTFAIEISDDGRTWTVEGDEMIGQAEHDPARLAVAILNARLSELPAGETLGWVRAVVWEMDLPGDVGLAEAVATLERRHLASDEQPLGEERAGTDALLGRRVRLISTPDPHTRLQPGALGTVTGTDNLGTLLVDWDDGSRLGLLPDQDEFEILDQPPPDTGGTG